MKDYFDIFEDTLIGTRLESYRPQKSRKFVSAPKFYFFDVGVAHFINKKTVEKLSPVELGKAFEHLVYCELRAFLSYTRSLTELFFWRTQAGSEVDFVLKDAEEQLIAIEVKFTKNPNDRDLKGLRAFERERKLKKKILICNAERARKTEDGCWILPIMDFVGQLWKQNIL